MNTKKLLFFVCIYSSLLISVKASSFNQAIDWVIVCGSSYITPFLGAKSALPKDFDLEKARAQTPQYMNDLAREQCIKQHVDPSQFSVVTMPDSGACIWNISLNSSGFSVQKLVAIDKKFFEPPYNCGQAMLAHEIGHLQHHHPQKGIAGFLATPLLVQYIAHQLPKSQHWYTSIAAALLKICFIKTTELILLGKLAEYQADSNIIKYCQKPTELRNIANILRTEYYQTRYVIPAQLYKKHVDNYLEQAKFMSKSLKTILRKFLSTSLILNWKLLTNPHPHPFARAKRFDEAAEKIELKNS